MGLHPGADRREKNWDRVTRQVDERAPTTVGGWVWRVPKGKELSNFFFRCDNWHQLENTHLYHYGGWIVCHWSSKRTVWSIYVSKAFDLHRPEYLITLSGTSFVNWSQTLPLHREWVVKSTGFSPITAHAVFNSLRNSLYVIFRISWSFPDPFKDLNIIGKFDRLWGDSSETFTTVFLTKFWRNPWVVYFQQNKKRRRVKKGKVSRQIYDE